MNTVPQGSLLDDTSGVSGAPSSRNVKQKSGTPVRGMPPQSAFDHYRTGSISVELIRAETTKVDPGGGFYGLGAPGASGKVTSTSKDVSALPASFVAVALTAVLPPFWGLIVSVLPSMEADTTSLSDDET